MSGVLAAIGVGSGRWGSSRLRRFFSNIGFTRKKYPATAPPAPTNKRMNRPPRMIGNFDLFLTAATGAGGAVAAGAATGAAVTAEGTWTVAALTGAIGDADEVATGRSVAA